MDAAMGELNFHKECMRKECKPQLLEWMCIQSFNAKRLLALQNMFICTPGFACVTWFNFYFGVLCLWTRSIIVLGSNGTWTEQTSQSYCDSVYCAIFYNVCLSFNTFMIKGDIVKWESFYSLRQVPANTVIFTQQGHHPKKSKNYSNMWLWHIF